jgi:hypothetical protein
MSEAPTTSLAAAQPNLSTPAASSLAHGLNIGTVLNVANHWREFYNPLRALDLPRAIALYDFSRRGLTAELQNCYREMEQLYPCQKITEKTGYKVTLTPQSGVPAPRSDNRGIQLPESARNRRIYGPAMPIIRCN